MALALEVLAKKKLNLDNNWDPFKPDKSDEVVNPKTSHRIMMDIMECVNADAHHIFVVPDSKNVLIAHVVVVGAEKTPYEGGFFYFFIKFPANYPMLPPRVKLMNTDQNSIRFNPNIYKNGMICLSILGTFTGPGWNPLNTLYSVLLSIQSLMNENPFHNAPDLRGLREHEENTPKMYNHYIRHETIRVAVINFMKEDNLDTKRMPKTMRENVTILFKQKIRCYFKTITDNMFLDNVKMFDPFNFNVGGQRFDYNSLKTMMGELTKKHQTDPDVLRDTFKLFGVAIGGTDDSGEQSECSTLSDDVE